MSGSAREYTVACAARKAIPDPSHLEAIRDAVLRVHQCTYAATELLNLYVRDRIENHNGTGLEQIFTQNWLINAYYAVSTSRKTGKVDSNIQAVFDAHMNDGTPKVDRKGLTQALTYECINLAAVGSTNVWMHFRKRVLAFTRTCYAMDEAEYAKLSKDERRARKLALMQAADDMCRPPGESKRAPETYHAWIDATRNRLKIDEAVGDWGGKPLLYHLKSKPHRFLFAMHHMSTRRHAEGCKAFALFPLRRSHVPRHMRFDQKVLCDLLDITRPSKPDAPINNLNASGRAPKRKRTDPSLLEGKALVFNQVLNLRAAGVHRRHHFAFAFTTDGVSLHLNMVRPGAETAKQKKAKKGQSGTLKAMPMRGVHSIDALKAHVRARGAHVVGIDPGKRELVVAVDSDDPQHASAVRYTLAQRRRDLRTRQYEDEVRRSKKAEVHAAEEELSEFNSKAPSLAEFAAFVAKRRQIIRDCPEIVAYYSDEAFRSRRRKVKIKAQQSEARLVKRLRGMHKPTDLRPLVLAYGAWGLTAGQPGMPCSKGNPPAVGVGLMKRLALDFVVMPTPEHHTSKTCVKCGGLCGPHPTLKTKKDKEIRGLRVCQHEGCGLLQNRDKTGATNIGSNGVRLLHDQPPIRAMSAEELEFHRLNVCVACE